MAQARLDENKVPTIIAVSDADGETPLLVFAKPVSHALMVEDGVAGSDLSGNIASRDQNVFTVLLAVSNADGITPTEVYVNAATNRLLVKST